MRQFYFVLFLGWLLACLEPASAQPYGSDLLSSHTDCTLLRISPLGVTTTIVAGPFRSGHFNMLTMDSDNTMIVVLETTRTTPPWNLVYRMDPGNGRVVSTIFSGPPMINVQHWVSLDQNGDYLVCEGHNSPGSGLYKIKSDGSRISTLFYLPGGNFFCFTEDKLSGDWVIGDARGMQILQVDRILGTMKTSVALPSLSIPTGMQQDPALVDIIVGATPPGILAYDPTRHTLRTLVNQSGFDPGCMTLDRAPSSNGALIYTGDAQRVPGQINRFDRQGRNLGPLASTGQYGLGLVFEGSRNLAPCLVTAPNDRSIRLSFPGSGGRLFVLAMSLLGCTPGVKLPDSRVIPLNPDHLTSITAAGAFPPFVTGNIGFLDAGGRALVRFNANPLGLSARGLRVWAAAAVLDSNAPSGVDVISPPLLFVLE
ncbi:MAG: hypothetical protein JXA87_04220 [Thermoleophilia bacterium]|nr:hypothetical protein [Thermoleophilia bacterium]